MSLKTIDDLWAVIALDNEGNEIGVAVYQDCNYGPMPLVSSSEKLLAPLAKIFAQQSPATLHRVRRFKAGPLVELAKV